MKKICEKLISWSFYLLFLLVPLVLTPFNFELFEFNKMLVVYAFSAVIVGAWLIKMVLAKKIIFRRSFWDIPLIIFLLSQVASFMFSVDKHTSFWGYYSRFNGGLLSVICYLLLYWAFVSNMEIRETKNVIRYTLISVIIISLYGILEHFGHSFSCLFFTKKFDVVCWVQDVQNRVFATIGQPNWLAAYLVALIPLTWAPALATNNLELRTNNLKLKMVFGYLLSVISYLCLLFTRSRSGLLGFGVAFGVFWLIVALKQRKKLKLILAPFLVTGCLLLVISLIVGTPYTPSIIKKKPISDNQQPIPTSGGSASGGNNQSTTNQPLLISESSDIRKVVWKGAIDIWRHYPIFGTGPETFAYSYYWFRPREHNDLSEWDFLYNKAHNEYLNYAATTGTVGLIGYLILIGSFVLFSLKKISKSEFLISKQIQNSKFQKSPNIIISQYLNISLLAGFSSILITNFFGFSVVPVSLFFFLFPAFAVASAGKPAFAATTYNLEQKTNNPNNFKNFTLGQKFLIISIILVTSYQLLVIGKYWQADTRYSMGEKLDKSGQYDKAFSLLQQAIKIRGIEPVYRDELSLAAGNLAVAAKNQKNEALFSQLLNLAISESNQAINSSPMNLSFWKNRTKLFYKLAEVDEKYFTQAFEALLKAAQLAPTEPKIKYNLALLYGAAQQNDTAISILEETIKLKPNYEEAYYALGLFYEQAGQKGKAKEQYQNLLKINPSNEQAKEKLKIL